MDILELLFQKIQAWRIVFVVKLVNQDAFYLIEFNFKNIHRNISSKYFKIQIHIYKLIVLCYWIIVTTTN